MKLFRTFLSLTLCALMLFAFSACGEKAEKKNDEKTETKNTASVETVVYNGIDLTNYVTFKEYKGMKIKDGVVENGDIANIDYCGKKDGVAFDGGTAQGYDLSIGSGSFIDGFEEGLIGAKVGETRDLNLTFPEQYQSEELAGQAVVFTVTVNSVEKPLVDRLVDLATIKDVPENQNADDCCIAVGMNAYFKAYYGADLDYYAQYMGTDIDGIMEQALGEDSDPAEILSELKADTSTQTALNTMTACYALFQKEGLQYDTAKLNDLKGYTRLYEEYKLVKDAVNEYLTKNAVKE